MSRDHPSPVSSVSRSQVSLGLKCLSVSSVLVSSVSGLKCLGIIRLRSQVSLGLKCLLIRYWLYPRGLNFPVHWDVREIGKSKLKVRFGKSGNSGNSGNLGSQAKSQGSIIASLRLCVSWIFVINLNPRTYIITFEPDTHVVLKSNLPELLFYCILAHFYVICKGKDHDISRFERPGNYVKFPESNKPWQNTRIFEREISRLDIPRK